MKSRDFLIIPATTIGVMIVNVLVSIGVVWVYSTFFDPGQPLSHYQAFAKTAAPISSVVAGIPLMFLAGFLLARGRPSREAMFAAGAAALLYIAADAVILAAANVDRTVWTWTALSYPTKLLAALAGGFLGSRRADGHR